MAEMSTTDFCAAVSSLVRESEAYRNQLSPDRERANEYFDGEMKDTPADDGRSQVVSRDVRAEIKKVLPSIKRIILRGAKVVEYEPVGPDDEQFAEQATDYVNILALPECEGKKAIRDAIDDAAKLRNGVIKWWQDEKIDVKVSMHTGLDEVSFTQLVSDDSVEVLEHSASSAQVGDQIVLLHDVKIRRKVKKKRPRLAAVKLENFLVHPDTLTFPEAPLIGENYRMRRSDLVAMGYDREKVDKLPVAGSNGMEADAEEQSRRRDITVRQEIAQRAMQEIEYYDLLVRVDFDDDGIAELRRVVFAGGIDERYLIDKYNRDEVNYADVVIERRPHQWEGNSVTDDVDDIQRIKTVLVRQTLDNLYWQNNQQPIVQEGMVENPEAVTNPAFGLPIRIRAGVDVRTALGFSQVPMVADKSFAMLQYLDQEKQDRTGINDASAGLPPDALQNVTAKASAMLEQSGIGQTEDIVEAVAESLKPVFRGLLKLIIQHQDQPRTVRLRGKWVQFDPRTWNADMDCTVNTGLGAGTRERDMMAMGVVTGIQEKLLAAFGPINNPFVTPAQLYNGIAKMTEAAGLKSVDQYFSNPSPEQIKALTDSAANKPSEEQEKAQGAVMVEQAKGQIQLALKDKDIAKEASKEREQRDADLVIKQAELEKETQSREHEALLEQQRSADQLMIEREKIASNERIKFAELSLKADLEREKMDREDARAERQRQADVATAHMQSQQAEAVQ